LGDVDPPNPLHAFLSFLLLLELPDVLAFGHGQPVGEHSGRYQPVGVTLPLKPRPLGSTHLAPKGET